jgi:hypothetical protein
MEIVQITQARHVGGYQVWLRFSDGSEGVADLSNLIHTHEQAVSLKDVSKFANFKLDDWPTLVWDCGFDVAPEKLYELVTGKAPGFVQAPTVAHHD